MVAAAIIGIFFVREALFGFPIFKPKSDIVDDNVVVVVTIKDLEDVHASLRCSR
jgi:hypothetical protein